MNDSNVLREMYIFISHSFWECKFFFKKNSSDGSSFNTELCPTRYLHPIIRFHHSLQRHNTGRHSHTIQSLSLWIPYTITDPMLPSVFCGAGPGSGSLFRSCDPCLSTSEGMNEVMMTQEASYISLLQKVSVLTQAIILTQAFLCSSCSYLRPSPPL